MNDKTMTPEFQKEIVDFLKERIESMNGYQKPCCGADLSHEMTMDENNTGAWIIYVSRANDFVNKFRQDAEKTIAYYRSVYGVDFTDEKLEIGEYGNPEEAFSDKYVYDDEGDIVTEPEFDDIDLIIANNKSEVFTFFMLYWGVEQIVNYLPCVNSSWNENITFDDEFTQRFLSELEKATEEDVDESEEVARPKYGRLRRFVEITLDRGYLDMGDGRIDLRKYKRLSNEDKRYYAQDVVREFGFDEDDQKALSIVRPIFG